MSAEEWRAKEDVPQWRRHGAGSAGSGGDPPGTGGSNGGGGGAPRDGGDGLSSRDDESYYDGEYSAQSAGRKFTTCTKKSSNRSSFG